MSIFEAPFFCFWNVVYTALGAAIFWGKLGGSKQKIKAYVLSDLLEKMEIHPSIRIVAEFVIFVTFGCLIGIGIVKPINVPQAIAAGLGWTGLLSKIK
jgi:hypothetical protein